MEGTNETDPSLHTRIHPPKKDEDHENDGRVFHPPRESLPLPLPLIPRIFSTGTTPNEERSYSNRNMEKTLFTYQTYLCKVGTVLNTPTPVTTPTTPLT